MRFDERLKELPQGPGIYMMKDSAGNIIYVGKAKNLKNRVSQYFSNQKDRAPKIAEMVRNIRAIDYTVTDTELDAFIEECRLIREIKPRYNSQMKNDKNYTYIKIPAEEYPRISITTEKSDDGSLYFGPFTSLYRVESAVSYLNDFYSIRKCAGPGFVKKLNGCLYRQLGTCAGACTGEISPDEYGKHIESIRRLLNGEDSATAGRLIASMDEAVENLEFEKAAKYREYYIGLRHVIGKQRLIRFSDKKRNFLVIEFADGVHAKLFLVKGSKLLYRELVNTAAIDFTEFTVALKRIIRENFDPEGQATERLTQQDIDEAQIIYSYFKKNKKRIMSFWIPSTRLSAEMSGLDSTVSRIVTRILSHSARDDV